MEESQRDQFCYETIRAISGRVKWATDAEGKIQMNKRLQAIVKDFGKNANTITVCALWTIKPEFRKVWMEFLGTLVGMEDVIK